MVFAVASLVCAAPGCVQRRLTVRSNPPGALVYIDDYEIGTTPVATDYIYYGTRKIRLVKDGYETLTVQQPIKTPWYEYPVAEFVSENLVPWEIRDERVLDYQLVPQVIVPSDQLLGRAENLRQVTRASAASSAPVGAPLPSGTLPLPAPAPAPPQLVPPGPRSLLPPALSPPPAAPQLQAPAPLLQAPSNGTAPLAAPNGNFAPPPVVPAPPSVTPQQPRSGSPY
ncbi:MAG: PEGA domain-containing protein [Pirellulales bacterium]|nr:PEGA domain-containing protein [Pirellulales bacterium]